MLKGYKGGRADGRKKIHLHKFLETRVTVNGHKCFTAPLKLKLEADVSPLVKKAAFFSICILTQL